ncbi:MAG TPA: PIN domain-containing protein [Thermoanaerobaculia bacterium]|nr:PIN domain-containing protein [Thermoanaerobaculia bacterium]
MQRGRLSLSTLVDDEVAVCPIVVMEVLRGARDLKRYHRGREMFSFVRLLDAPTPMGRFEDAARIYLQCRDAGVTPSTADCLVAACAIAHEIPLLHNDADFRHIARVVPGLTLL